MAFWNHAISVGQKPAFGYGILPWARKEGMASCAVLLPLLAPLLAPHQPPTDLWACDFMPCICWKEWQWCTIAHKFKHKIFTAAIKAFQLLALIYLFCLLCQFLMIASLLFLLVLQTSEKSSILQCWPHLLLNFVAISNHPNSSLTQISYNFYCLYYFYGI